MPFPALLAPAAAVPHALVRTAALVLSGIFTGSGAASAAFSGIANAGPILTELKAADYITVGNLDWAWAAPVTQQYFGGNELFQASLHAGWREASDLEWAHRPGYIAFGHACASKYWNSSFIHCDFDDILSQHWVAGSGWDARDLLYVRDNSLANLPEPAMLALLGAGMLGIALLRRA